MIDEALYSLLIAYAGLTALVSTRIYPMHLPQQPTLPAVSYQRISSGRRDVHHGGITAVAETIFQVSCWATTLKSAKDIAAAVRTRMHGYNGTVGSVKIFSSRVINEVDLYDPETNVYHVPVDVAVLHRES